MNSDSQKIIHFLLAEDEDATQSRKSPTMRVPVKIQHPDGTTSDAEFTGYFDFRETGQGVFPAIGYKRPGEALSTHGVLRQGDKIITHIPSFDAWERWVQRQMNPKATQ